MPTPPTAMPSVIFDHEAHRLRGVATWDDVARLGRGNVTRMAQIARDLAAEGYASAASADDLREIRRAADFLEAIAPSRPHRPFLPRLRNELFHKGDALVLYLGDSDGQIAPWDWVPAVAVEVSKAHRPEWAGTGVPNSGFYWQTTARAEVELFPGTREVRFSTTEPRALLRREFEELQELAHVDAAYFTIFCENAQREWQPIWCIERGTVAHPERMDMAAWLLEGSRPATR
jgi:hypothetical protein